MKSYPVLGLACAAVVALLFGGGAGRGVGAATEAEPAPAGERQSVFVTPADFNVLKNGCPLAALEADFEEVAERLAPAPVYQKVAILRSLVKRVEDLRPVKTEGFRPDEGAHDLRVVGGRAAWALERLLGTGGTLPAVTQATTPEQAKVVAARARELVDAYRAGVLDVARLHGAALGAAPKELAERYRARIRPGLKDMKRAGASGRAMGLLLEDWFPLGRRFDELQEIVGQPPNALSERDEHPAYKFVSPLGGIQFEFEVVDGVIVSVVVVHGA